MSNENEIDELAEMLEALDKSDNQEHGAWGYKEKARHLIVNEGYTRQKQGLDRDEVLGALARGYCHDNNKSKELDASLIEAMGDEIIKLSPSNQKQGCECSGAKIDGICIHCLSKSSPSNGLVLLNPEEAMPKPRTVERKDLTEEALKELKMVCPIHGLDKPNPKIGGCNCFEAKIWNEAIDKCSSRFKLPRVVSVEDIKIHAIKVTKELYYPDNIHTYTLYLNKNEWDIIAQAIHELIYKEK